MVGLGDILKGVVAPVVGIWQKKVERKTAKDSLKAKAAMQKEDNTVRKELTDAEWEIVAAQGQDGSWKDEWVTIIFTLPIPGVFIGALHQAYVEDSRTLDGIISGVNALNTIGVPMGELMTGVVFAAVGLKLWRA